MLFLMYSGMEVKATKGIGVPMPLALPSFNVPPMRGLPAASAEELNASGATQAANKSAAPINEPCTIGFKVLPFIAITPPPELFARLARPDSLSTRHRAHESKAFEPLSSRGGRTLALERDRCQRALPGACIGQERGLHRVWPRPCGEHRPRLLPVYEPLSRRLARKALGRHHPPGHREPLAAPYRAPRRGARQPVSVVPALRLPQALRRSRGPAQSGGAVSRGGRALPPQDTASDIVPGRGAAVLACGY